MNLIFNELSCLPLAENETIASQRVEKFVKAFSEAQKKGFKKIRFASFFHEIEISAGFTIGDWIKNTTRKNLKDLLLSVVIHPFIDTKDTWAEDAYIVNNFHFEDLQLPFERKPCLGLAAAHIYDTASISQSGCHLWDRQYIPITKIGEDTTVTEVQVLNIYSKECVDKQEIKDFIENTIALELLEDNTPAKSKPVHFRDDHGTDVLQEFANRIVNCVYVKAVINSLPFNSKAVNFVRKTYPNGQIELVLHWEDKGYGMVIQTTGRNKRETDEIASRIKKKYDNN